MELKTFEGFIKLIQDLDNRQSLLNEQLRIILNDADTQIFPYNDEIIRITKLLKDEFDDKDDRIEWWIYENDYGKKTKKMTTKNLYQLLMLTKNNKDKP